ncbi:methyltransferase family protein [Halobaculum gomorrense]|uniref:Protein-S-isoprenylcysteine O-methyltransferase Ste14 n=1 Tax=Halobaculum gomorrense TaxID=43928 RepID=A0A1M5P3H2_9EURY|nr:PEMT/PEM2 methyltransferase family protein [Halobaculum gomorrense]SHG96340.1 Protein-S-isoprenylcysteine O-methyltransferase Ste14 [Halobaculum gomorrense]
MTVVGTLVAAVGVVGMTAAAAVLTGLAATLVIPDIRIWPPGDDDRLRNAYLACSRTFFVCLLVAGALGFGGAEVPAAARVAGGVLAVVAFWTLARADLGEANTRRRADGLVTEGTYGYSRNPQVVGFVGLFVGYALATAAPVAGVLAALGVAWMVASVFVEEPWLREQYGAAYETYRRSVPRFVGVRTLRRVLARD